MKLKIPLPGGDLDVATDDAVEPDAAVLAVGAEPEAGVEWAAEGDAAELPDVEDGDGALPNLRAGSYCSLMH